MHRITLRSNAQTMKVGTTNAQLPGLIVPVQSCGGMRSKEYCSREEARMYALTNVVLRDPGFWHMLPGGRVCVDFADMRMCEAACKVRTLESDGARLSEILEASNRIERRYARQQHITHLQAPLRHSFSDAFQNLGL